MTTLVILKCGEIRAALSQGEVRQILALPALSKPPTLPASFAGFANLAGQAVPVVELSLLFERFTDAQVDPLYRHVLIIGAGADRLGLLVDRVLDVRECDLTDMVKAGEGNTLNDCVEGDVFLDGEPIHLLSSDRILIAAERARITDLQRAEQARIDQWRA